MADTFRLHPDLAAIGFNYPFDQCQSQACSSCINIQFIEQSEDVFMEFRFNTDSVVAHKKYGFPITIFHAKFYDR